MFESQECRNYIKRGISFDCGEIFGPYLIQLNTPGISLNLIKLVPVDTTTIVKLVSRLKKFPFNDIPGSRVECVGSSLLRGLHFVFVAPELL